MQTNQLKTVLIRLSITIIVLITTSCTDRGEANFKKGLELHNIGKYEEACNYFMKGGFEGMPYIGMYWYRGLTPEGFRSYDKASEIIFSGKSNSADLSLCRGHAKLISISLPAPMSRGTFLTLTAALEHYKEAKNLGYTSNSLNSDIDVDLDAIIKVLQKLEDLSESEKRMKKFTPGLETSVGPVAINWGVRKKGWGIVKDLITKEVLIGYWSEGVIQPPYIYVSRISDQVFNVGVYGF